MTKSVWLMSFILTTLAVFLIPLGRNSYPVRILVFALLFFGWITAIITIVLLCGGTYYI